MWNPSPEVLRLRERAYLPGRYTKSPESQQKQWTLTNYKKLPVNLPPLQLKNKVRGAKIKQCFMCTLGNWRNTVISFILVRPTDLTGFSVHAWTSHRP